MWGLSITTKGDLSHYFREGSCRNVKSGRILFPGDSNLSHTASRPRLGKHTVDRISRDQAHCTNDRSQNDHVE